jgi:hypothetical protein
MEAALAPCAEAGSHPGLTVALTVHISTSFRLVLEEVADEA